MVQDYGGLWVPGGALNAFPALSLVPLHQPERPPHIIVFHTGDCEGSERAGNLPEATELEVAGMGFEPRSV